MKRQISSYVGSAAYLYWLVTEGQIHPAYQDQDEDHDCHAGPEDGCDHWSHHYDADQEYEMWRDQIDEAYQIAYENGKVDMHPDELGLLEKEAKISDLYEKENLI